MTDLFEDQLVETLQRRAARSAVPPVSVDRLIDQGRAARRGRGRWLVATAAVAAVAAAVIGAVVVGRSGTTDPDPAVSPTPTADPTSLADLPVGPPLGVPFLTDRTLHLADKTVDLTFSALGLVRAGDGVLAWSGDGRIDWVDLASGETSTLTTTADGAPVSDPTGGYVAWLKAGHGQAVVQLAILGTHGVVATRYEQAFPASAACCASPFTVAGITSGGLVLASSESEHKTWSWSLEGGGAGGIPASSVQQITGLDEVAQVSGNTLVVYDGTGYSTGTAIDGSFHPETGTTRDEISLSPTGQVLANLLPSGEITVLRPADLGNGGGRRLRLPTYVPLAEEGIVPDRPSLSWEDDRSVLITYPGTGTPSAAVVRCDAITLSCERPRGLGAGDDIDLPR